MIGFGLGFALGGLFAVLGAGGGLLAVPILLVLFELPLSQATGAGLAIVFAAAITSAIGHARHGRVDYRTALLLGPAMMLGAVGGAQLHTFVSERATAAIFALVLLVATGSLFLPRRATTGRAPLVLLLATGLALGVLTGFLGVGGGFLLVPVLVGLAQLPLQRAVGTSAALIALSSFAGGAAAMIGTPSLVPIVGPLAAGAVLGAIAGVPLVGRLPERGLRVGFAALSLTVAGWMLWRAVVG